MDINRLTLGEVAKIEELSQMPISTIGNDDAPKGLVLAAMAFVAKRRVDPKFTWNDAQGLTFDEAQAIISPPEEAEAVDPTEPPSEPSAKTRAKK